MKKIKICAMLLTVSALIASCKKDSTPVTTVPKVTTGLYVLSEGNINHNNTTLTYYSFSTSTATTDFFAITNVIYCKAAWV